MAASNVTVTTSFRDTTAPGWIFGGSGTNSLGATNSALLTAAAGIDTIGNGWLRLTSTSQYLAGYALYTNAIPSTQSSIFVSLDMAIWRGSADGFVLFFYDASVPFSLGGNGGSLGYAQRYTSVNGMGGAYLGLGVDEFGNFSNPNEGRIGGPGQVGNGIAVRGPGAGVSGYKYIAGTGDGITPKLPTRFYFDTYTSRPSAAADARHLEILLSPNNQLTVYLRSGISPQTLVFVADLSKYTRPNNLKMGFTAGTGGVYAYHELQNVFINATVGTLWSHNSADSLWGTASNWTPTGVPVDGDEINLNNTYVNSSQTIDLGGTTRIVRGISFDADFPFTLTNGTLSFSTNSGPAGRLAISQSSVNGNANMTIATPIQISDDLTVDNAALGLLSLNGNLANQGHAVYFAGMGNIAVNGIISGAGQVVNYRSILTLTNNTFSGGTLLQNGTTILGGNEALGSGNVVFSGGTLQGANGTRSITNSFSLPGTAVAIGGSTPLTFTGLWSQTGGNAVVTINNTALTQFSGGILLANVNQSRTLTLNVATSARVDSVIANGPGITTPEGLIKAGLGTLTLSATNTYSGMTTVSEGTLALGDNERLNNSSSLLLAGGTLGLAGYTESISGLGYTNSAVDFGSSAVANYLMFTTNMSSSGSLVIFNFQAGTDRLAFPDSKTMPEAFINGIYFSGYGVGATVTAGGQTIPGYSGTWKFIEPAAGQSIWDGGSAVNDFWSSSTNWAGDVQPSSGSGVNISFEGTARLTPDLDTSRTAGLLSFGTSAGAFALHSASGATLTLDGNTPSISQQSANNQMIGHALTLATNTLFDTIGAGKLIVSGAISGTGGIAKYNSGELSLTTNNSYTGANVFYNGLVNLQNGNALGSTNAGTRILGTATLEIEGNINVSAEPLSLNSPGFNNEGAICNESGINSYAGTITLEGASRINTDAGSLTLTGTISNSVAGVWGLTVGGAGNVVLSNVLATGTGALIKDGSGTLTLRGVNANTYSGLTTVRGGQMVLQKKVGVMAVGGDLQIGDGSGSSTVQLLARDQISDAANVTLSSSGVLDLNGNNETLANLNASSSSAHVLLGTGTLTVSSFDNSIFGGVISGSGTLVKNNAGTLTLTGPNTYTGITAITGGVLRIEHSAALGNNSAAATVASGAALELMDGITVGEKPLSLSGRGIGGTGGGALRSIAGNNSWAGQITLTAGAGICSDAGTLSLSGAIVGGYPLTKTGAGTLILSGLSTYSGGTTISNGMIRVAHASALGNNSAAATVVAGAALELMDGIAVGAKPLSLSGNGISGTGGGALRSSAGNDSWAGQITLAASAGICVDAGTLSLSGSIVGGYPLAKTGVGMLMLSGNSTYSGGTTISNGTLSVANSSALGLESNPLTICGDTILQATDSFNTSRSTTLGGAGNGVGGTFDVATGKTLDYTASSVISGTGSLIKTGAGTLSLGGVDTYTGGTYIKAGTLVSTSGRAPGPQPEPGSNLYAHHIYDGATLQIAVGSWATERQVQLVGDTVGSGGAAQIDITNGFTQQRNGLIYGDGKLNLVGTGTLIITGPNTYAGGTVIERGVFQANNSTGSATGSGAVTVKNNGTLSGLPTAQAPHTGITGSASGAVEIQSTGKLLARSSGTLALGGLTLDAGAISTFQLGALTALPLVNITVANALTLSGSSTIAIVNLGALTNGTYHLIDYSGTALDNISNLSLASSHSGAFNLALTNNTVNTSIDLVVTAITDQWKKGGADTYWSTSGNWWATQPNSIGDGAQFINNNGEAGFGIAETSTLDASKIVGAITFNNINTAFTIAALSSETLTLDQASGNAVLQVLSARSDANHSISAPVILNKPVTVAIAAGTQGLDISGSISGSEKSLTKTDAGPLTLSGGTANTYNGLTEVAGGTLNLNKTPGIDAIGSGGLQIDYGATATLLSSNQIVDSAIVTVNGTFALGTQAETVAALDGGGAVTIGDGGVLTLGSALDSSFLGIISGTGRIVKTGTEKLTLNGINSYSNGTTINDGILQVSADNNLGHTAGEVAFGGGTLFFSGSFASSRKMLLNSGGGTLDTDGSDVILTGEIRGTGNLTKMGAGTVKLGAANNYSGATSINNGILRISDALSLGTTDGATTVHAGGEIEIDGLNLTVNEPLTLNGGEVCNLGNTNTYGGSITLTADSGLDADDGMLIITSGIGGDFGLTKDGPGTVKLSTANTYNGATIINSGILRMGNAASLGSATAGTTVHAVGELELEGSNLTVSEPLTLQGGKVCNLGNTNTYGGAITLTGDSEIGADAGRLIITSGIEGAYGLTKFGPGSVELTSSSTYSGTTTIDAGTLILSSSGALAPVSSVILKAGATLDVSAKASPYDWGSGSALSASGSGLGETAAVIKGASGGMVDLGTRPISLTFTPTAFSGDTTHPALVVSSGTLALDGNTFTVVNASGVPLGLGIYRLIEQASGTISTVGSHAVSVIGAGLERSDVSAIILVSGGYVDLLVQPKTVTVTTWPTASTITNGLSLSSATLQGGVASNANLTVAVPGAFTFDAPETVPGSGIYRAAVTFTPTDLATYNSVTGGLVRVNRFPVAVPKFASTSQGQSVTINVGKLLNKATDVDGDSLTVASVSNPSANGCAVSLNAGVVTYTPAAFSGTDTVVYVVSDGFGGTAENTVTVTVAKGTSGPVSLNIVSGPDIDQVTGQFVVHFAGIPGYTYTVERTDTLKPPAWTNCVNLTAPLTNGLWGIGIFELKESTDGVPSRFYRTVWPAY